MRFGRQFFQTGNLASLEIGRQALFNVSEFHSSPMIVKQDLCWHAVNWKRSSARYYHNVPPRHSLPMICWLYCKGHLLRTVKDTLQKPDKAKPPRPRVSVVSPPSATPIIRWSCRTFLNCRNRTRSIGCCLRLNHLWEAVLCGQHAAWLLAPGSPHKAGNESHLAS
jgi:hypothetical protein